jgi:hypothetical protein
MAHAGPKFFAVLMAAALSPCAVFAQSTAAPLKPAERERPFYISVSGGTNLQNDQRFRGSSAPTTAEAEYKTGAAVRGAIGYKWNKGFIKWLKPRTEIEVSYSKAKTDSGATGISGRTDATTIKLGLASDIRWSETQTVVPYFASGYGIAIVDASVRSPTYAINGNRTRFAQHNSLGISYIGMPKMDIYAEGRFSKVSGANFDRTYATGAALNDSVRAKTKAFEVTAGTRLRF